MDFDEILNHVGHFGRYQIIRVILLMLGPICGGIAVTSFIFTGKSIHFINWHNLFILKSPCIHYIITRWTPILSLGFVPKYRCGIAECEDLNNATYYKTDVLPFDDRNNSDHLVYSDWVNLAISQISPNKTIKDIGCKRIWTDFDNPPSPAVLAKQSAKDDRCSELSAEINANLSQG